MPRPKDTLDRVNIKSPCTADWDEMVGNDEVRFCRHCDLSVHNLSAMTRQQALRLVISSNGKLCARYVRRPDGAIHTTDLVIPKLHSIKRRVSRIAAGAFTAALSVSTSVAAAAPTPSGTTANGLSYSTHPLKKANSNLPGTTGASLNGVVKDEAGAVIPGAVVTLINEASCSEYNTTTDDEGAFRFQSLEGGSFKLTIELAGFATKEIDNLTLQANGEQTVDATLEAMAMGGAISIAYPSEPLVAAVVEGNVDAVKELLATGANVDVLDENYDSTALSQAVLNGNLEIVDVLISAGADVNMKNNNGHTALMTMSPSTTAEIVMALINAGAKTDLQDNDGKNALHYAAINANPDTLRVLLYGGAWVDARDEVGRTALLIAASAGNTENLLVLLKAGATVNLCDENGMTALGLARENDQVEVIKILESYGGTE